MIVGHRGAPLVAPENTLASFDAALDAGADAVEFDVRLTAEGTPVVLHDPTVDRTTDGRGAVRSMTLDEVKRLRIDGSLEIPTLGEALAALSGRATVDIELKNIPGEPDFDVEETLVAATLQELDRSGFVGDVIVSSFNPFSLARSRELAPEVATGLITDRDVEARAALAFGRGAGIVWVLPFVDRVREEIGQVVADGRAAGILIGTWVVDDPVVARELLDAGVDAVATNDPAAVSGAVAPR